MDTALIGLLGVVAGALLGGVVSLVVARRNRRASAYVAGLLVAQELTDVETRIDTSLKAVPQSWMGNLPHSAFDSNVSVLASEIEPAVLKDLVSQYAIVKSWQREYQPGASTLPPELPARLQKVQGVRASLEKTTSRLAGRLGKASLRWAVIIVAALGIAILVVPRPDLTPSSIADVVQSALPSGGVVQCGSARSGWNCTIYGLTPSRGTCAIRNGFDRLDAAHFGRADPGALLATECPNETEHVTDVNGELVGSASLEEIYRSKHAERIGPVKDPSFIQRFLGYLTGNS